MLVTSPVSSVPINTITDSLNSRQTETDDSQEEGRTGEYSENL